MRKSLDEFEIRPDLTTGFHRRLRDRVYKKKFMLNSAEHEIITSHNYQDSSTINRHFMFN